jgi:hypothetical protein
MNNRWYSKFVASLVTSLILLFQLDNQAMAVFNPFTERLEAARPAQMHQFITGGHVLGFTPGGMYAATGSHALHVDFAEANSVQPQANSHSSVEGKAAPLGQVTYADLWPGIALTYTAEAGSIYTTTYTLSPGADPVDIRLRYNAPLTLNDDGTLSITFDTGSMTESAPIAWQDINSQRVAVKAAFRVRGQEVSFALGAHNAAYPLTIDPTLTWNTFLGGNDFDEGTAIAVDGSGNVYVAGSSGDSWGSPVRPYTLGTICTLWSCHNTKDAFAAKLSSTGSLTWNTFLGESRSDNGTAIAVDGSGNVYVAGWSGASWGCSPVACTVRPFTPFTDAFIAKLSSTGDLTWNTFLGGSDDDYGYAIAVGGSGDIFVAGSSDASWGSPIRTFTPGLYGWEGDAFACKLSSTTGDLAWNTFLGGSGSDTGSAVAVDGNGNVYVAGTSGESWGSPVRPFTAGTDAYTAKLSSTGGLTWNTFLGGSGYDTGSAIAVDGNGNVYMAGTSGESWGSPVRPYTASKDAFAAKLSSTGSLTWNTFLGGSGADTSNAIAVDGSRDVYVAGVSDANWGSPLRGYTAGYDAFAAKIPYALPPPAPTNVQASDGTYTNKVKVSWNASSGATSYEVYRATSAAGTKSLLGSPTGTSFNDTTATPGVTYRYWVKACSGANCSSYSASNTGWRKLSPPTGVTASDGTYTTKVRVSWNAASGATSYKVYRAASATGTKSLLGSPTGTSFNDTTATPGVTYRYWVKACRSSRCSSYSAGNFGWRKLSPLTGVNPN